MLQNRINPFSLLVQGFSCYPYMLVESGAKIPAEASASKHL
ncbi:hypothetical protein MNBD_GAMMA18-2055 [hydrothermal vent metagenome]|uniref:Uncharacterized protein n=1 Tax=hydrothermal vent metagenome TaxID=652676 RepID=A0A3B0ZAG1_9ZZZZ